MWPAGVKQLFPADIIGLHAKPAATQRLRHAHLVIARPGGGHADFLDQIAHRRRKAAILLIFEARILQQLAILFMPRDDLLQGEIANAVPYLSNGFR